jgi:ATP-dependent Clp protease ATP-binding subunit ClpA
MANEWGFRVPSFTAQMSEAAPGAGGQGREEVNGAAEAPSRELAEQIGSKLGKNARRLMTAAESHSLSLGHRSIGTGDILWALFHEKDQVGSVAVRYLAQRGITRETVYSSHKYSDNAAAILKLAANRAMSEDHDYIGTEDLLFAVFHTDNVKSRSQAVDRLLSRGINRDLVWGKAELSPNIQVALAQAISAVNRRGEARVGTEDLLDAIFAHHVPDQNARHWLLNESVTQSVKRQE